MIQCLYCKIDMVTGLHAMGCPNRSEYPGLPEVNETPPMPKVKSPKPEDDPIVKKEVIQIQPGDVLVLTCNEELDEKRVEEIGSEFELMFPDNKTIILGGGSTLDVHRLGEKI